MENAITISVAYRGQHGNPGQTAGCLRSAVGSYTFSDSEHIAGIYARDPNNQELAAIAVSPVVLHARLTMRQPLINDPSDPFVELSLIEETFGRVPATELALRYAHFIENTNNWAENYAGTFSDVQSLLSHDPSALSSLYLLAYPLLDDPRFVALAKSKGYDGAIHAGYGQGVDDIEYRVFDPSQVKVLSVEKA